MFVKLFTKIIKSGPYKDCWVIRFSNGECQIKLCERDFITGVQNGHCFPCSSTKNQSEVEYDKKGSGVDKGGKGGSALPMS